MPRRPDPNQLPLFLTPPPEEPPTQPTLSLDTPPPAPPSAPSPSVPLPSGNGGEAPLPPPPDDPPEVAADIRAMFLEEEERQRAEETITIREGKPPLVTGIYRKPRPTAPKPLVLPLADPLRPTPPPSTSRPTPPEGRPSAAPRPQPPAPRPSTSPATPPPPRTPRTPRPSPLTALRTYLSDAPLGRKGLLALLASILLVSLLAWWSGRPTPPPPSPAPTLASTDLPSAPPPSPEVPLLAGDGRAPLPPPTTPAAPASPAPPASPTATASATATAPATPPGTPAKGLRIPGATVTLTGDGAWRVQYTDAVFVSSDKISIEGMKALKATAAALLKLPGDVTITIHGHTDDIPPPPDATGPYRTNADLATARATVAQEHLNVFCKRQSRFTFQVAPPSAVPAPYPNDTPAHRRLNRTITLRIVPSSTSPS